MPAMPHTVRGLRYACVLTVIAQTAYPRSAASARVRLAGFVTLLDRLGVELDYRPTLTDAEYAVIAQGRRALPKLRPLVTSMTLAARRPAAEAASLLMVHRLRSLIPVPIGEFSPRIDVYDFDDAMFVGSGPGTGRGSRMIKVEARRWARYVASARLVIAGNEHLAAEARRHARRVEVVPSCVDPDQYPLHEHRERPVVTIGWMGSRTTSRYLKRVLPAVERLNRDGLRARLVAVGGGRLPAARWLEQRPWSLEREAADLAEFDVGVLPLPDNPWTQGKCGYKALQYFAAGIPVIASPVGVNARLVGTSRGRLADSDDAWYRALEDLLSDAAARRQMGEAGRRFVEAQYSYERWAPELAAMFRSLSA
jgi:glycosyltransferase involved in cell wall biosynthesis